MEDFARLLTAFFACRVRVLGIKTSRPASFYDVALYIFNAKKRKPRIFFLSSAYNYRQSSPFLYMTGDLWQRKFLYARFLGWSWNTARAYYTDLLFCEELLLLINVLLQRDQPPKNRDFTFILNTVSLCTRQKPNSWKKRVERCDNLNISWMNLYTLGISNDFYELVRPVSSLHTRNRNFCAVS